MSMRLPAGILRPGYNPLLVANAPTIGTATNAGATSISVAFTAPSCTGGSVISTYTAYCTTTGTNTATGASSPLVVTGLTTGQAYTFRVVATNIYGPSYPSAASNSATPAVIQGQQAYTTAGTFTWVAPAGVTSVSVVAVGGGSRGSCSSGAAAGGGGGLGYKNNIAVSPGTGYTVVVGAGATSSNTTGGGSSFINTSTVAAIPATFSYQGGTRVGDGGGNGGSGGFDCNNPSGGGGAGGYSGNGGDGATGASSGTAGSGGGGGGGAGGCFIGFGNGGGVGILGQGSNGAGGVYPAGQGGGGSGGQSGICGVGGLYGGGGGRRRFGGTGAGAGGAVRIIWPGTTRSFPSTNTGDL